jgi:hypothetical protein
MRAGPGIGRYKAQCTGRRQCGAANDIVSQGHGNSPQAFFSVRVMRKYRPPAVLSGGKGARNI